jgi:hypothetical protein
MNLRTRDITGVGTISKTAIPGLNRRQKPSLMAPIAESAEQFPVKTTYRREPLTRRAIDPRINAQPDGRNSRSRAVHREIIIERDKHIPYNSFSAESAGDEDDGPEIPVQYGNESSEPQAFYNVSMRHVDPVGIVERHTNDSKRFYDAPSENTQPPQLDDLLQRISELEKENSRLKAYADGAPVEDIKPHASLEPKWKTLYRIDQSHIYLDEPQWVLGDRKRPYMKAGMSVHNLALFIERNPDIAFVVYKDYNSRARDNNAAFSEANNGVFRAPEPYAESLSFVSDEMKSAMQEMAGQVPDFSRCFPRFEALEDVPAPYLFMYYAKQYWDECQSGLSLQSQRLLSLLKQCIMESYGAEYEAADGAFADGLVSGRYMKYLVRPGDVLVMTDGLQISAFMSLDWIAEIDPYTEDRKAHQSEYSEIYVRRRERSPTGKGNYRSRSSSASQILIYETSSPSYWRVNAWSWEFAGSFEKKTCPVDIELPTHEQDELVQINSLAVRPVRFAGEEVKSRLERRGKTFWSCRRKQLVSYHVEAEEGLSAVSLLQCLYSDTILTR